jgi:Family of unknown function (DUF6518)
MLMAVVVGVVLGAFSTLADGIIGGRLIGILGNIASPWGLAAFFVGRGTTSRRRGAALGAVTLLVGVATYYVLAAGRGYVVGSVDALWTGIALVAGPVMGWAGAATRAERPPIAAVIAPGAMLVAEALFLADDRRVWRWNLRAEPYRLTDLAVMVAMVLGGLALTAWLDRAQHRRSRVLLAVVATGVVGAVGFAVLKDLIVGLA